MEYMKTPADAETLGRICAALGISPAGLLRGREPESAGLRAAPDVDVLAAMAAEDRVIL